MPLVDQQQQNMRDPDRNVDPAVTAGFGHEWTAFRQGEDEFSREDRENIFRSYFSIFPWQELPPHPVGIDVGCGSGRWSAMVAPRVGHLHLLDASKEADRQSTRLNSRHVALS